MFDIAEYQKILNLLYDQKEGLDSLKSINKTLKEKVKKHFESVKIFDLQKTICSKCKKVRDDDKNWNEIHDFLKSNFGMIFSHGMCPDCTKKLYPDLNV